MRWASRASFIAVSTASEPDPHRNTRASGIGVSSTRRAASSSAGPLENGSKQEYAAIVRSWVATASAISARPWPAAQYQRLAIASTYSLPSASQTRAPSPRAMTVKDGRVGLAKGCRNGGTAAMARRYATSAHPCATVAA